MKNVLIVDDEPEIIEGLKAYLEFKGFSVSSASNGREAVFILEKEKPGLVFLDILLKGDMNGMDVLKEVKTVSPDSKIVMLTGMDGGPKEEAERLGVVSYLNKPVTINQLNELIEKLLLDWY